MVSASRHPKARDVILFAPVGGNSGILATLAWELASQRGLRCVEWHVVVLKRGDVHMKKDTVDPGGALDRLHALDPGLLPREGMRKTLFRDARATADGPSAAREALYLDAVLHAAREAVASAGNRPVVFALVGGRDRVMTVAATLTAQLLARPQDLVVDIRVTPAEAVAVGRYVLPTPTPRGASSRQRAGHAPRVDLVDVPIPRLQVLLPTEASRGFAELLRRSQEAIDSAAPVPLELDLGEPSDKVRIAGIEVKFTAQEKLVLAALAIAMERPGGSMRWPSRVMETGHPLREVVEKVHWAKKLEQLAISLFVGHDTYLTKDEKTGKTGAQIPKMTEAFGLVANRARARLTKLTRAHPDLPPLGIKSKRTSGKTPYSRVWLYGLTPTIHWPEDGA